MSATATLDAERPVDVSSTWNPEDPKVWAKGGAQLASRTLWITTAGLTLSFATWYVWSAVVVRLPELGFQLTVGQRFWLAAIPGLVGATLRIPYSFLVQIFGTRPVVTLGTASLLIPSIGIGWAIQDPTTPYWVLAALAATAGFGGGNFSAFMSSTSYFFPRQRQGTALGLQAGIGNFGVSLIQFLVPIVVMMPVFGTLGGPSLAWTHAGKTQAVWIQNAAFIWAIPVLLVTIAAAVGLRSIPVTATFAQQAVIFRRKHNWIMTSLYVMTFGTFSGMSAVFALLIREIFGKLPDAPDPLRYAFLGALIGSATRPVGGWISDKVGGARVTLLCGALLLVGTIAVLRFTAPTAMADFSPFFWCVMLIFFAAGIGNGSTFRMIPCIFPRQEAGPVLGWTAAIAAYGSFVVPMLFNWSLSTSGSVNTAFIVLAVFYAFNLVLCWWYYARRGAEVSC